MQLLQVDKLQKDYLENIGFSWHTDEDGSDYISNKLVCVKESEANAYYEAVNELYDMFIAAAQEVIDNDRFDELGIPFNLIDAIKMSWENEVHWHLYGRFDLAGGLDGKPIKLIEFNADTPTALFESAILQWALLKQNGMDESAQFNSIYESLMDNF
ncbi:glutathionylspermidine synthase family protein, partial [Campylobacter jejuni]